jgi:hypothetical protein
LGGTLFTLTHFHTIRLIKTTHLTCVFPSLTKCTYYWSCFGCGTHFLRLQTKFTTLRLSILLTKCVGFFTLDICFHILSVPMNFITFSYFFIEAFQNNLITIVNFLIMIIDPHATFVMFSFCYA